MSVRKPIEHKLAPPTQVLSWEVVLFCICICHSGPSPESSLAPALSFLRMRESRLIRIFRLDSCLTGTVDLLDKTFIKSILSQKLLKSGPIPISTSAGMTMREGGNDRNIIMCKIMELVPLDI